VYKFATANNSTLDKQTSENGNSFNENGSDKRKSRRAKKSMDTLDKRKLAKRWINNAKKMEKLKMENMNTKIPCEIPSTSNTVNMPLKIELEGAHFSGHHFKDDRSSLPNAFKPCVHKDGQEECDSECRCRKKNTSCEKFCTCSPKCTFSIRNLIYAALY